MDVNKLMYALDNDDNESIMNLTTKKIMKMNLNILNKYNIRRFVVKNIMFYRIFKRNYNYDFN